MQGRPSENTALLTIHRNPIHQAVRGINNDDDISTEEVVDTSTLLGRLLAFYYRHEPALNVSTDLYGALAVYLLVNNELSGDPETYDNNLNNLNLYFLAYLSFAFIISIVQNNVDKEKHRHTNFVLTLINQFIFMLNLTASNTNAFQTDLLAGQAQITNPEGGPNDVSSAFFIRYDLTIPFAVGGLVAFRQYLFDTHKVLKENDKDFTKSLVDKIPQKTRSILHKANLATEVLVNGGMVFGSSLSDALYYSMDFCGFDFMKYKQYVTTSLYASCLGAGMLISILAQTKHLPTTNKQLLRINLATSVTVGTFVFYRENIRDSIDTGVKFDTMFAMAAFPVLLVTGATVSLLVNHCRNKKQPINNNDVLLHEDVEQPGAGNGLLIEEIHEDEHEHASAPINIVPADSNVRFFGRANSFSALGAEKIAEPDLLSRSLN